jgi:hypothetical protein
LAGLSLAAALVAFEFDQAAAFGWILAVPMALSSYLLISGTFGICIYYGLKGERGADHGTEALLDPESRAKMRARAVLAVSASVLVGCIFAAAFVASA